MSIRIFRRPYQVRRASQGGKEVTIPPEVPLKVGDTVVAIYDGFVLFVPKEASVNEEELLKAIKLEK